MQIYLMLVLCVFFWAGNFVLGRYIKDDLDPIELSFYRWLGVLIIFLPYIIQQRVAIFKALKEHFVILFLLSGLGVAYFNTGIYIGLQDTTATNALLINSSVPIFIILFSIAILHVKVTLLQLVGIFLSLFGVVYIVLGGDIESFMTLSFNKGDIWIVISSISWALYSVLLKLKPKNFEPLFPTTVLLGTIMLCAIFLYKGHDITHIEKIHLEGKLAIAYVIIFPSIVSFYLWHEGIKRIGANETGQFIHLMPIFGVILAYLFLGEKLYLFHIIGFFFVAFGIYLSIFLGKKE